jgi:hypothetical protein
MNSKLVITGRIFLGLIFSIFGLNGFLNFLPMPPQPENAGAFMGALAQSGYMFPLINGTEVIAGILLLANIWISLGLILLAPVIINIFMFHVFLAPGGLPLAILVLILELFLAWSYKDKYAAVLSRK